MQACTVSDTVTAVFGEVQTDVMRLHGQHTYILTCLLDDFGISESTSRSGTEKICFPQTNGHNVADY